MVVSSKGELRVWTGEVESGFQEVLCAVTSQVQISKHLCCEGQTPCRRWQRACVEKYYCPWGRVAVVAPACALLHPLSLELALLAAPPSCPVSPLLSGTRSSFLTGEFSSPWELASTL